MRPFSLPAAVALLFVIAGLARANAAEPDKAIAVIVSPDVSKIPKLADVALIFRRKKLFWNDGTRVAPVNLQASNPLRQAFSRVVLGASPEDMERYWNDMYFHGISPPFVLSSQEAVLRFVAQTPGAIGYVSYCAVDARVRVALVLGAAGPISEDSARASCPR
jgi:ABC-type phosphate transport system substrate-binding protein